MKLDWHRPGVVRATLKVEELAVVVAGARLAAAALAAQSPEQSSQLEGVLRSFDGALEHLGPFEPHVPIPVSDAEAATDESTNQHEGANA